MKLHHFSLLCLSLTGTLFNTGCASTLNIPWVNHTPKATARNPVVQIACMWEPSEGRDPSGAPCRGFAGQVLFLGNKGGVPVAVEGDIMVYVFDDLGTPEEQAKPIHQFHFDSGAWNRHMRVGSLGPAYHCFIPYTRPGLSEANCSLRVKFTPASDKIPALMSDASHIALQGKSRRRGEPEQQYAHLPKQAYQTSRPLENRSARTTTIPLDGQSRPTGDGQYSDILPAGYSVENETTQQKMQRILDEYRQEQSALEQHSQHGHRSQRIASSPRMKLSPTAATGIQQVAYTPESGDSGIQQATWEVDATDNYNGLHPVTANTADGSVGTRPHPLLDNADARPLQAQSVAPWQPAGETNPSAASSEVDLHGQTSDLNY